MEVCTTKPDERYALHARTENFTRATALLYGGRHVNRTQPLLDMLLMLII